MSGATAGPTSPLAYFWGDDADGLRRAVDDLARDLGGPDGPPLEIWRADTAASTALFRDQVESVDAASAESTGYATDEGGAPPQPAASRRNARGQLLDAIELRVGTAPLFGGGVLVVVQEPAELVRAAADRARVERLLGTVATGNGLAFTELSGSDAAGLPTAALRDAVAAAGGTVRRLQAPRAGQLPAWIERRAGELGVRLDRGAAALLAERLGGLLREGDIDRRRQTELADAELRKLALYRPDGPVTRDDVSALVAPALPASTWGFLDAVAERRVRDASAMALRLEAEETALPIIVTQLHHRLRQLLEVNEARAGGATPAQLVRTMHLKPFRAEKLWDQAGRWSARELGDALVGLLEVDLAAKRLAWEADATPLPERLALDLWLVEHVARR